MSNGLLLDTCAAIWLLEGEPLSEESREAIRQAAQTFSVCVSVFVAWEVALLHARRRRAFTAEPRAWFALLSRVPGITVMPVTASVLITKQELPGNIHKDPADPIMIATAREYRLALVTRDQAILDYGQAGHISVLEC